MRRPVCLLLALIAGLAAAPPALAASQAAQSGNVSATLSYQGKYPNYHGQTITIARSGQVVYRHAVTSKFCGTLCGPASVTAKHPSVSVLDLEHNGEPDVVLRLFSEGAHCCWIDQVFTFDPATGTYSVTEHDFGDPGERLVDLRHDGRIEFLTADDAFAYAFTDYAASALPVQVLTFAGGRFTNVTRSFPKLVAKDAAAWLKLFRRLGQSHWVDTVGVIAAWAADEDLLGHRKLVSRYLTQQLKAGHITVVSRPVSRRFPARLDKFLRKLGYLR